jgi:carbon monoxide dehydrogenase subunit G
MRVVEIFPLPDSSAILGVGGYEMQVVETFSTTANPEAVWQVLADVSHWKDWTPTVLDIIPLDGEDLQVGARYRVSQPEIKPAVYEVTACVPNEGFIWVQKMPGGGLFASHTIQLEAGSTKVVLSFFSKGLLAGAAATLFSSKIRKFVSTEARSLKEKVER